jgi:chromosome segregation ATPase
MLGADPQPRSELALIVADLKDIEAEMLSNQQRIEALQNRIGELQILGKDAEDQIHSLQTLVETHADRVQQLGERYSRVLVLAQNLKNDLEWSRTLNWVLGGTALVAVAVAVGEGIALGSR